jgi:hypothetical protein
MKWPGISSSKGIYPERNYFVVSSRILACWKQPTVTQPFPISPFLSLIVVNFCISFFYLLIQVPLSVMLVALT